MLHPNSFVCHPCDAKTILPSERWSNFCLPTSDEIEVAYLKSISKDDLLKFYEELLDAASPGRHKIAVYVQPPMHARDGMVAANDQTDLALKSEPNLADAPILQEVSCHSLNVALIVFSHCSRVLWKGVIICKKKKCFICEDIDHLSHTVLESFIIEMVLSLFSFCVQIFGRLIFISIFLWFVHKCRI